MKIKLAFDPKISPLVRYPKELKVRASTTCNSSTGEVEAGSS
jgi:hypothetical protein